MKLVTFRIFRRSENRQGFGHRNYFLMARNGVAFQAQRVYDLPINGEIQVPFDPETNNYDFGSLGFECSERLNLFAPKKVIQQIFKPVAIKTDTLLLVME
jgi:hypothetical protein